MLTGLDAVAAGFAEGLRGRRVALLMNHTAVDSWGRHAAAILPAQGIEIVRLLAPEHGIWGTHQDMEPVAVDAVDEVLRLPVTSLYGADRASLEPAPAALEGVDAVVYDIQDVGARYYTYAATLALTMRAAASLGVEVWVLDRPNPIGPRREGPLLRAGFESFCGLVAGLPIRHGLTVGQLARWYRERVAPECKLTIVPCNPNGRAPWMPTSPNMPSRETALVYPGMCLLEGTTVSEGRGTTSPFLQFGAPGLDPIALVDQLRKRDCPGVDFVPVRFRPAFGKHAGRVCSGVYLRVFDATGLQSVRLGVYVLHALKAVAPDAWGWRTEDYEFVPSAVRPAIDLLWGSEALRGAIDAREDVDPLIEAAQAEAQAWKP
ncbi:MAG: DUF1343 domain-containing protein [Deltaproteobacteria bacterium]|nr:DUF1343 domain-containing protein [Deltaproteobacteria bacterium]